MEVLVVDPAQSPRTVHVTRDTADDLIPRAVVDAVIGERRPCALLDVPLTVRCVVDLRPDLNLHLLDGELVIYRPLTSYWLGK